MYSLFEKGKENKGIFIVLIISFITMLCFFDRTYANVVVRPRPDVHSNLSFPPRSDRCEKQAQKVRITITLVHYSFGFCGVRVASKLLHVNTNNRRKGFPLLVDMFWWLPSS